MAACQWVTPLRAGHATATTAVQPCRHAARSLDLSSKRGTSPSTAAISSVSAGSQRINTCSLREQRQLGSNCESWLMYAGMGPGHTHGCCSFRKLKDCSKPHLVSFIKSAMTTADDLQHATIHSCPGKTCSSSTCIPRHAVCAIHKRTAASSVL